MCFDLITGYEINLALTPIIKQCHSYFEDTYLCIYIYIKEKAKRAMNIISKVEKIKLIAEK